jgi:hypothetical protein
MIALPAASTVWPNFTSNWVSDSTRVLEVANATLSSSICQEPRHHAHVQAKVNLKLDPALTSKHRSASRVRLTLHSQVEEVIKHFQAISNTRGFA